MNAHDLARYLLKCPNLPVKINGWGSAEGTEYTVSGAAIGNYGSSRTRRVLLLGYNEHGEWNLRDERLDV